MILYRGMTRHQGGQGMGRIQSRVGRLSSPSINLANVGHYNTQGISTSADPAVAFVFACANGAASAVYAIWVSQGLFYRGLNVRAIANIGPQQVATNAREQSIINQQEHVLQSVAAHQIIGWFNVSQNPPKNLVNWVVQPRSCFRSFTDQHVVNARHEIETRILQRYPNGLDAPELADDLATLTGPAVGQAFG